MGLYFLTTRGKPYAATAQGRRHLSTVMTRAKDQLRFVARRVPSPLLTAALAHGLVIRETTDGAPGTFSEDAEEPFSTARASPASC